MINLGPLGLYEDINDIRPRIRDLYTSYATENTDYLIREAILVISIGLLDLEVYILNLRR